MSSPNLRRRFNIGLSLWVLFIVAAGIALATPLDQSNLNPVIIAAQTQARQTVYSLSPYLVVAVLGAGVGLAELSSTFDDYPREAIATRWGQYLVWLNAVAAALAFFVVRSYAPRDTNVILLIVSVGAGFPTLIRTKFTVAKQFSGQGDADLNINIGWLYEQFQNLCKKQIDLELMSFRYAQVNRLLANYSTVQELYQIALYTLSARTTLSKDEETAKREELQQAIDPKAPPELARMNLGLMILEWGGLSYVDRLVDVRSGSSAPGEPLPQGVAAASPAPDAETVVKRLTDLPLADLEKLAMDLLRSPEDQQWVKEAAEPAPGIAEKRQKAPIAYYVVAHAGVEAALEALKNRS